ncbi:SCP extracellular domain containing protein [Aphelenchoides besseyi]|nr:SCP extracellular domain containing protein [Aphelenchoides besseyi]KAI6198488.1 SCP extracellular domain containing protein [Aphelenchoides besseyi]
MNCVFLVVFLLVALTSADVLNSTGRQACVDEHNRFRGELARGKVVNKGGERLQKAVDMNELVRAIKKLVTLDSEIQRRFGGESTRLGQEVSNETYTRYQLRSVQAYDSTALKYAAGSWWSEVKNMSPADLVLTDEVWKKDVGHFTQMAWSHCASVGCAVQVCDKTTLVVCNYDQGNLMNAPIYKAGRESCSACDFSRTVCRNDLCAN